MDCGAVVQKMAASLTTELEGSVARLAKEMGGLESKTRGLRSGAIGSPSRKKMQYADVLKSVSQENQSEIELSEQRDGIVGCKTKNDKYRY